MKEVFRELIPLAARWKTIGTLLGISEDTIDKIKADEEGVDDCLRKMLSEWLKAVDPPSTWRSLADAVEAIDLSKTQKMRNNLAS